MRSTATVYTAILAAIGAATACGGATTAPGVAATTGATSGSPGAPPKGMPTGAAAGSEPIASSGDDGGEPLVEAATTGSDATAGQDSGVDAAAAPTDASRTPTFGPRTCVPKLSQGGLPTGFYTCDDGTIARGVAMTCPSAPTDPSAQCPSPQCTSDSACAAHAADYGGDSGVIYLGGPINGNLVYCADTRHITNYCGCWFGCMNDSDCNQGSICECGAPVGICVPANCVDDRSCGPGHNCIATLTIPADTTPACVPFTGGTHGYYCETAKDQCATNLDCPPGQGCYLQGDSRVCATSCPVVTGRPFLVEQEARRAPVALRRDWSADLAAGVKGVPESERALLARHWAAVGQMEHASVGAFARFALDLLAIGAPADLVMHTHKAMGDEIEHARLCFALASAYGHRAVGPGPLSMAGVAPSRDKRAIVHALIREGCIGETVAAVEASELHDAATDPVVRAVLATIARDETDHAALSWKALAWIVATSSDEERRHFAEDFGRAVHEHAALARVESCGAHEVDLSAHGVAGAARRGSERRRALAHVIAPARRECFAALSQQASGEA